MDHRDNKLRLALRLRALPKRRVLGREVAVAAGFRSRLLGLSGLSRDAAGAGLLIANCASVHTFGMRFALDLVFLDGDGRALAVRRRVRPGRLVWHRGARAVLEIPSPPGESLPAAGA
jgi:uncharacterized protein